MTSLGPVLDISLGGARLLSAKPLDGRQKMKVRHGSKELVVVGTVAWSKRLGFRRHEIGLQFSEVDEDTARALTDIASEHAVRCGIAS